MNQAQLLNIWTRYSEWTSLKANMYIWLIWVNWCPILNGLIRKIFHKTHGFNCFCDTSQCWNPRWNPFARQMFLKSCRSIDNCFTSRINGEWAIYVKQHAGCGPRGDFQTDGKLPLPGMVPATMPTMWHVVIHTSEY